MLDALRRMVWRIPRGKVATYGQIAEAAGFPGRARQVAWALRASTDGIPWHRVVGAGGQILLRGHPSLEQRMRLEDEGVTFSGGRIRMREHEFRLPKRRRS